VKGDRLAAARAACACTVRCADAAGHEPGAQHYRRAFPVVPLNTERLKRLETIFAELLGAGSLSSDQSRGHGDLCIEQT